MFPIDSSELYPAELKLKLLEIYLRSFQPKQLKMLKLFYLYNIGRLFQYYEGKELFGIILVDPH